MRKCTSRTRLVLQSCDFRAGSAKARKHCKTTRSPPKTITFKKVLGPSKVFRPLLICLCGVIAVVIGVGLKKRLSKPPLILGCAPVGGVRAFRGGGKQATQGTPKPWACRRAQVDSEALPSGDQSHASVYSFEGTVVLPRDSNRSGFASPGARVWFLGFRVVSFVFGKDEPSDLVVGLWAGSYFACRERLV